MTQPIIFGQFIFGPVADQAPPDLLDQPTRIAFDSIMSRFIHVLDDAGDDDLVLGLRSMGRMWRWMLTEGI